MEKPPVLLILNPVSGQGDYAAIKTEVEETLQERRVDYVLRETEGEGDALRWAREAKDFSLVLVGGGDGTIMEAMSGMIENPRPIPLAQLGMGTANLLARALAIPTKIGAGLDLALESGVSTQMDVGYLTQQQRYFALVAGSGWDARMIQDANRELKNRLGFLAYVWTGLVNLFRLNNANVTLEIDGQEHSFRAHTVEVINVGEIYGTGIALGEDMSPHDGNLNVAIASSHSAWGLFKLAFRIFTKHYRNSTSLQYFTASRISVDAEPPLPLQIDGEAIGQTPYEIEVVPNGVRLIVPREYAETKKLEFESNPFSSS
ncbi:MAG: diacylglycerol kinase family lipid kinase [Verrucomicrobiales bacterium]|nr:diacylglycerol kinase family lipid kinase [Verrucomicrobiales bacterium]